MKLFSLLAATLLTSGVTGAIAHAQSSDFDASLTAATSAVATSATPALADFAGETAISSPITATYASGLQLNRTSGHDSQWAKFASGTGNILFLSAGTLLPLVEDGKDGQQHSIRTVDALVVSTLLAEGLKEIVHKKRPDGSDYKSFPSGHATAAFTVAAMQARYHPKQAIFWYAGATAIAASRVTLRRHDTSDVIAGAALGFFTARWELNQNRGLLLRPFIRQTAPANRVTGLSFSQSF